MKIPIGILICIMSKTKDAIKLIDGNGGGNKFNAQGGGKNSSNLEGTMEYALRKINTL